MVTRRQVLGGALVAGAAAATGWWALGGRGGDDPYWGMDARDLARTAAAPDDRGPREGVSVAWERTIPAATPPRYADGTVFVAGDALHALAPGDGATKWSLSLPGAPAAALAVQGGLAVAVTERDGGHVVTAAGLGGRRRWETSVDVGFDPDFRWVTVTPTDVYLTFSTLTREDSLLVSLGAAGGDERWRAPVSPVVPAFGREYAFLAGRDLVAVDPSSGDVVWRVEGGPTAPFRVPAVRGDTVYVTRGYRVEAYDAADGARRWRHEGDAGTYTTPAVGPKRVYVGNEGGLTDGPTTLVTGLDPVTGDVRWTATTDTGTGAFGAPSLVGDALYVGGGRPGHPTESGLHCLDAGSGDRLWKTGEVVAQDAPVVADGRVYATDRADDGPARVVALGA